ncbi:Sorting nexin-41 [Golovinomyces cichoracearum]|uniref:Sorting nexin-41 n=1 Tax=Golovinomyces cichoracearum TaxID=62708 RepID=A0A420I7T5_9PEZI|nr:Sorting nexin-41 [Golovinomyces cichoracearum]
MWNDEDNNPYGIAFEQNEVAAYEDPQHALRGSRTHSINEINDSNNEAYPKFKNNDSDTEKEEKEEQSPSLIQRRSKVGYDSRIEQILYENPELPILIVDAGKSLENGSKYIVYTIRTGDLEVRRRYSEFASLRDALSRLHPTLVVPPIPEKHTMADYAANPTQARQDQQIIDLRKRMLTVFLNRCRLMDDIRNDGVWWRFLDPNSSWNEVIHSHPVASIPKSIMKAPPLDPANPSAAHVFLPIPPSSARLKATLNSQINPQGMLTSPSENHVPTSSTTQVIPGSRSISRFPLSSTRLSETELDPYFINFESAGKELELLLTGPLEKVNRRTLNHLSSLSLDFAELGARFNGFALSESSSSLASAIERVGQAIDTSYLATEELSGSLGASFAEPLRESALFAGVVRSLLRYRVLKRVQQEMINEELAKKRALLDSLEKSEVEAKRIEKYLHGSGPSSSPRSSITSITENPSRNEAQIEKAETASIDSDFPPTHSEVSPPSAGQGVPSGNKQIPYHRKSSSGNFITNKIFVRLSHAVHGVVDVDPERTRRDLIGKTRENINQLEQAQSAAESDVKDASFGILKDLRRFQAEKEDDLKQYMLSYAKSQIEWAKKNLETWEEAKAEINKIDEN